jgi:hypothetical protein
MSDCEGKTNLWTRMRPGVLLEGLRTAVNQTYGRTSVEMNTRRSRDQLPVLRITAGLG